MDAKFTEKLQHYMSQPESERNVEAGATLLLQLNKNRILFQNIIRRPDKFKEKLFYELSKFLEIRLDEMTVTQIIELEKFVKDEIEPVITATADEPTDQPANAQNSTTTGKRVDHDSLPDEIKAIYVEQATIAHAMRDIHTKLRLKSTPEFKPCDRYQELDQLVSLWKTYRVNWEKYDNYGSCPDTDCKVAISHDNSSDELSPSVTIDIKRINANRKYLSFNRPKLASLQQLDDQTKFVALLSECQKRYDELKMVNESLADDQLESLVSFGLKS